MTTAIEQPNTAEKPTRRWTLWLFALASVIVSLLAWGFLHPELTLDNKLVSPTVREQLSKAGFKATQRLVTARFETVESQDGHRVTWESHQTIAPVDALFSEKRSRRRIDALSQQFAGLYVGPFAVVRYTRNWPPLIGDLLPYHFWESSRMSDFTIEEKTDFPDKVGGRISASVAYDDRYADGQIGATERRRLLCQITDRVDATSINPGLPGPAVRVDCKDLPQLHNAGITTSDRPQTTGKIVYSHWYLLDFGWSIAVEGEYPVRAGQAESQRKWSSKLISFE